MIHSLQFYSPSITTSADAMTAIGNNNYAADTLLADATWCNAICNSEYFESVLNAKVPVMTSDTTPSGVASASSVGTPWSVGAYGAFNGLSGNTDQWHSAQGSGVGEWIDYEFDSPVSIHFVEIKNKTTSGSVWAITSFKIQASNDGVAYADESNEIQNTNTSMGAETSYPLTRNVVMKNHWRLYVTGAQGAYICLNTLQLYGRKDV